MNDHGKVIASLPSIGKGAYKSLSENVAVFASLERLTLKRKLQAPELLILDHKRIAIFALAHVHTSIALHS